MWLATTERPAWTNRLATPHALWMGPAGLRDFGPAPGWRPLAGPRPVEAPTAGDWHANFDAWCQAHAGRSCNLVLSAWLLHELVLEQAATAATQAAQDNTRRDQAQRAQIEQLRTESDERRQANAVLSKLLEQRSKALADAQRRVGELHAAGVEALTLYRDKDRLTGALQDDPVLGLTGVRVENRVQALRQRLDGLQQPAPSAE